jgi:hypothetical protein
VLNSDRTGTRKSSVLESSSYHQEHKCVFFPWGPDTALGSQKQLLDPQGLSLSHTGIDQSRDTAGMQQAGELCTAGPVQSPTFLSPPSGGL